MSMRTSLMATFAIHDVHPDTADVSRHAVAVLVREASMTRDVRFVVVATVLLVAGACAGRHDGTSGVTPLSPTSVDHPTVVGGTVGPSDQPSKSLSVAPLAIQGAPASRVLSVAFAPQVPPGTWAKTMSCGPAAMNLAA